MRQPPSILIIEDNADMAEIYRDVLEAHQYPVTAARSGKEALEMAHAARPDVVVMDLMLPDMGWAQLLGMLRATAEMREIKLVLVSGRPDLAEIAKNYEAFAHFQKPFDVQQLVELLGSARPAV